MAGPFTPAAGNTTKLLSGSSELFVDTVEWDGSVAIETITPTSSNGWVVRFAGDREASVKMSGSYDFGAGYSSNPPNIVEGQTITAVHCKPNGVIDYTGSFIVSKFSWKGGPKNISVKFSAELMSTGALTYP